jgi:predicted Zn finger-like uncharacterized protein
MNVTCPNCATVYRVDPVKVPEAGVRARCAVCSAIFAVTRENREAAPIRREAPAAPVAPPPPAPTVPHASPPPSERPAPPPAPVSPPPASRPVAPVAPVSPAAAPPRPVMPPAPAVAAAPPRPAAPARAQQPVSPPPTPQAPPQPAARPAAATPGPGGRPANPFLSQDPSLKARRLARALISDIVVYHPAKRQEGIRDGNLKELFEEEIKKSWEEYTEQVGRDVAESTGFFREALNEILAGGRQLF